jgi:hypothetical protein
VSVGPDPAHGPVAGGGAVEPLNHRERSIAERIHRLQRVAYEQEAQLLGVSEFPPLQRTVADVQASAGQFFGVSLGEAPATRHRAPAGSITIASSPLDDRDETPKGFYLRRVDGTLWLRGYRSSPAHVWDPEDVFVFSRARSAV